MFNIDMDYFSMIIGVQFKEKNVVDESIDGSTSEMSGTQLS